MKFMSIKVIALLALIIIVLSAGCSRLTRPLPHSLYYLDGPVDHEQIWRIERDGVTRVQVTESEIDVDEFAVSPADGSIVFISENRLYVMDASGENRKVIADGDLQPVEGEMAYFRNTVSSPSFSPDGSTLAFGWDGIHLYDVKSGQDDHVLTNLGNLLNESYVFDKEVYTPGAWSPDGSRLVITMSFFEGYTLAVMQPGESQPFTRLKTDGAVCCMINWSEDSQFVLVANPYFTGTLPGLWRFDVQTGAEEYLVEGRDLEDMINFVGWPYQSTDGELLYFLDRVEWFDPEEGTPLYLVRSVLEEPGWEKVLQEQFHIRDALWTPDGRKVVIAGRYQGDQNQLLLVDVKTGEIQVLVESGDHIGNLAWGL